MDECHTTKVRVATWNIRAGGGKRVDEIAGFIKQECPDILVLTEFRQRAGEALLGALKRAGYNALVDETLSPNPEGRDSRNKVAILSRLPVTLAPDIRQPQSAHRWLACDIGNFDLTVLGVHVPNQSEVWNKREFWECIEGFAMEFQGRKCMILGDLNTAVDEDCQGDPIREAVFLKRLLAAGWVDAWRFCNPGKSEFTWFSHRANGFRLDYCLVSPLLADSLVDCQHRHDVLANRLSDHSWLGASFNLTR